MKTIFYALFFCSFIFFNAQSQRFEYEYKFVTDSMNKNDVKTEYMNLDVTPKGSVYYSYTIYERDSLLRIKFDQALLSKGLVTDKISKNYITRKSELVTHIGTDAYKIPDEYVWKWKILPDKKNIGGYKVQKAISKFGGRSWEAWFTSEIPVSDGPYKFWGLPGLIVSVSDKSGTHEINLVKVKKIPENLFLPEDKITYIVINKDKQKKLISENRKDPMKQFRTGRVDIAAPEGSNKSEAEILREIEQQEKKRISADNNWMELDLLK
ncbi:GLPGLI family protein [Elizabethkingia anophelis]|uniref:GLPGLI family protein n=1 Tax=Elizabethkingia anophelis TaxID=1117645 RepID=UPI000389F366|nr:GLPGLI family protein [Elizabethkingia anophelis]EQB92929.1 hypothetical protein C874_17520 [Elizabethkingia anophelis 502]MCT3732627.1 GLPGLI family protein [Elizabethkingia anophelis]MCT3760842.1 GLPGLI family protein [Elizabethkingia anophelis]MCT3896816.1 GLPGLI family protein [Elizabethkingia anophelis]MCT3972619.1 GLPGLI family protein [Elizabethkingia anophelis]